MMKLLSAFGAIFVVCTAVAIAQNSDQEGAASQQGDIQTETAAVQSAQADQNLDDQIAACLLLGNQEEIVLAQFAQEHAQNDLVKEFAAMLIEQHTSAIAKIQEAAPDVAGLKLATSDARSAAADELGSADVSAGADSNPTLAMLQRIKSECLKLTEKELSEYRGAQFDNAYVGQQVGAHLGMLAELRGSKSFASPKLQKVIAAGEKMTATHLEQGKKLMGQIKDTANKTASADDLDTASKR
jgi:predicted outer membrane protein